MGQAFGVRSAARAMRALAVVVGLGALALGCYDTRRTGGGRDSGVTFPPLVDGGARIVLDSGTRDAGNVLVQDAGPPPTRDSGTPPPACGLSTFAPLPAPCLPRCASSTLSALASCTTESCTTTALQSDPTPTVRISLPDGSTQQWGCYDCYFHQSSTCWYEVCPSEFAAYAGCDPDFSDCTAVTTVLSDCLTVNDATLQTCLGPRLSACFP